MYHRRLLAGGITLTVLATAVARQNGRRLDRRHRRAGETLLAEASQQAPPEAWPLDGLPDPVRRYFETVLPDDPAPITTATATQRGEFRLGGPEADWCPMEATQYFSTEPRGFVWDATIEMAPLLGARVLDRYEHQEGTIRATVLSTIPVASAGPSSEMNEGSLARFLAEAIWFPTALLPGDGVTWTAIDDDTARVTVSDGETTASMTYHFENGYVSRMETERYHQESSTYMPWMGRCWEYECHDGFAVPTRAEVGWEHADGYAPYWRASIEALDYE